MKYYDSADYFPLEREVIVKLDLSVDIEYILV